MINEVILNARKPKDDQCGYKMLNRMNDRHKNLHKWGLEHISIDHMDTILDIGFGGGENIKNMLRLAPNAKICGIDYSEASYKKCYELNKNAIDEGNLSLKIGSVENLDYEKEYFDLVVAFETIYYWPNIEKCFRNIYDILKDKGSFLICNEDSSLTGNEEIAEKLNMKFYDEEELKNLLENAGFKTVNTYKNVNGKWICAVGKK